MPRGDRTGPVGNGPMTGRGTGWCAGFQSPGFANAGYGCRGGRGFGHGFRNMYKMTGQPGWVREDNSGAASDEKAQKKALERQAKYLEEELNRVRETLNDFDDEA